MSVVDLVAQIKSVTAMLADANTLGTHSNGSTAAALGRMESISRGSTSHQLRETMLALAAAVAAWARSETALSQAGEQLASYIAEISGDNGSVASSGGPASASRQRDEGVARGPDGRIDFRALIAALRSKGVVGLEGRTTRRVPDFDPTRFNPACWQGLAPRQKGGPARGNLFFHDGRRWNSEPLESTGGVSAFDPDKIKDAWRDFKPALGHLEGNTAAWMADHGRREMVLYINEKPCTHNGKGCFVTLQEFLPRGYKLHVHSRFFNGTRHTWEIRHDVFRGTGKAFRDRSR